MIMTNRKMSRDSRKLFEFLDEIASKNGVQGLITPAHIYMCDTLLCQFYLQPVENVIRNKLHHIGKKTSKQFEITYWDNMVRLMLTDKSAMRDRQVSQALNMESFEYINGTMITDYSIEDALLMNRLIANNTTDIIRSACAVAKQTGVYSIQYISAVIDRAVAEHNIKISRIDEMGRKIERTSQSMNKEVHKHTIMDVALAQYEYQKKQEEYELELKMGLLGGK